MSFLHFKKSIFHHIICCIIIAAFFVTSIIPPAYAQVLPAGVLNLPIPGSLVPASAIFSPPIIKGITIHPTDPLQMNFIVNGGDETLDEQGFQTESDRLIKYFLASLTIPENELWVNLSPYEENRIVPDNFGKTQMGRDLLAQDYMLKQLTSSMMYPEDDLGKEFWKRVHKLSYEKFGTTDIPMNTFNKIWIVPEKAVIYEHGNSAVIVESKLKVLLEEDYLALENHQADIKHQQSVDEADVITGASLEVVREVLIPEIEKEINHGKTFSQLRQIYHSVILANWYKENLKESLLDQVYVDQNKTAGLENPDKQINQKIYEQYIESFKKGVYNYIKEDVDPVTNTKIPRHYYSGGGDLTNTPDEAIFAEKDLTPRQLASLNSVGNRDVSVKLDQAIMGKDEVTVKPEFRDQAMIAEPVKLKTHANIPGFRDVKNGAIYLEKFEKLRPLTEKFFSLYGGENEDYLVLKELGEYLEGVEVVVGEAKDQENHFDIDRAGKKIVIDGNFMDYLFTTGRKKIFMSFVAKALFTLKAKKTVDTSSIEMLITGGKESLFDDYQTRLDETLALYRLLQTVAINDTPQGAENPYYLSEDDIKLVVSDYLHRGKILNERKLRQYLIKMFTSYGEISRADAHRILEEFYQEHDGIVTRSMSQEESGIDDLKAKLDPNAKIIDQTGAKETIDVNLRYMGILQNALSEISDDETTDIAQAIDDQWDDIVEYLDGMRFTKDYVAVEDDGTVIDIPKSDEERESLREYVRSQIGVAPELAMVNLIISYGLQSEYMADPAFKGRSLVWDIEVERQDEVNFGGKSAHTGEMMFAPSIITLPNFFSSGSTFQDLFASNSFRAYRPHLVEKMKELEAFLKLHRKHLDVYADDLKENLEHQLNEMRVVVDESNEKVSEQIEKTIEIMKLVIADVDSGEYENLKDYFIKVGASLDQRVKAIKDRKKEILVELVKIKKKINDQQDSTDQNGVVVGALEHQAEEFNAELKDIQLDYEKISSEESSKLLIASRLMVLSSDLRENIKENLRTLAQRIGVPIERLVLAVRSSAVGEDSETASFAGRQDTYIFVTAVKTEKDPEGLDNIINSWIFNQASLFNKRAVDYRFDQGLPTFDEEVEISTLFQMMFLSELSYIAFSVDRDTGFPSMSMSFTEGQGESLVSGAESGSKFIVSYDGQLLVRDKGDRRFMIVETKDGLGKQKIPIPQRKRQEFAITDQKLLAESTEYFKILHDFYEGYVDLEGAIRSKRDSEGVPVYQKNEEGEILEDERGFPRKEWMMVSTQARPETVVSAKDEDVIELKRIVVPDRSFKAAEEAGQVLPFKFIAKTGGTAQGPMTWVLDKSPESLAKTLDNLMGTEQSDPDMNSAMVAAKGIIAALGGPNSHTMIVASEYGLVAITGLSNASFAELQKAIPEGTEVTIDAERGRIILGVEHELEVAGENFNVRDLEDTAIGGIKSSTIVASVANAMKMWVLSKLPTFKGIGLQRLELVLTDVIGVYPDALLAYDNLIKKEAGEEYEGPVLTRPENITTQDLTAYQNLLEYEGAEKTVQETTAELTQLADELSKSPEESDAIDKKAKKAEQKQKTAEDTITYLDKTDAPMLDRSEHVELIEHIVGYENLLKKENGIDFEGPVLDREADGELIQSIRLALLIKTIEDTTAGYNSGEDFYVSALSEWLIATAASLRPPKIEAVLRAQKLADPKLRLKVLEIVNGYYEIGLGHRGPLQELKKIYYELSKDLDEVEEGTDAYKLYYLISLLNKKLYIRLDDRKSDEYEAVAGAEDYVKREVNPMKGFRGLDLLLAGRQTLKWQHRAIGIAADTKILQLAAFVPLVRRPENVATWLEYADEDGLTSDVIERGIMTEIPTNSINIPDFLATGIDFTSTGGNDALQTVARVDRNTSDENLKNVVTGYTPSIVRFNANITASTQRYNAEYGTHCENGYCGNEPSVPGQEDYGPGLSALGHSSVSVVPQAFQGLANNLASGDSFEIRDVFKDNIGFQFEMDPQSLQDVQLIDYDRINVGNVRLGLGVHYRAFQKYDQELQEKAIEAELTPQEKAVYQKVRSVLRAAGVDNLSETDIGVKFYRAQLKKALIQAAKKAAQAGKKLHIGTDHIFSSEYAEVPMGEVYEIEEANPEYGSHGLVRAMSRDRDFLEIDLEVIEEVSDEFNNIVLDLKVVRNHESLGTVQQLLAEKGLTVPVNVDVEVTANLFEIGEIFDEGNGVDSISVSDPIRLTSDMMALEQNNINGVKINRRDVQYQLRRPVLILATAAKKAGKTLSVHPTMRTLTKDQAMVAQAMPQPEAFVDLLEQTIAYEQDGRYVRLGNVAEFWFDEAFIQSHQQEIVEGIRAARNVLLMERGRKLEDGHIPTSALANLQDYSLNPRGALIMTALGRLLGYWKVYPDDDPELDYDSRRETYDADPSSLNFPQIMDVNNDTLRLDAAMLSQDYVVQIPQGFQQLAAELIILWTKESQLTYTLSRGDEFLVIDNNVKAITDFLTANQGERVFFEIDHEGSTREDVDALILSLMVRTAALFETDVRHRLRKDHSLNRTQIDGGVPARVIENPASVVDALIELTDNTSGVLLIDWFEGVNVVSKEVREDMIMALSQPDRYYDVFNVDSSDPLVSYRLLNNALAIVSGEDIYGAEKNTKHQIVELTEQLVDVRGRLKKLEDLKRDIDPELGNRASLLIQQKNIEDDIARLERQFEEELYQDQVRADAAMLSSFTFDSLSKESYRINAATEQNGSVRVTFTFEDDTYIRNMTRRQYLLMIEKMMRQEQEKSGEYLKPVILGEALDGPGELLKTVSEPGYVIERQFLKMADALKAKGLRMSDDGDMIYLPFASPFNIELYREDGYININNEEPLRGTTDRFLHSHLELTKDGANLFLYLRDEKGQDLWILEFFYKDGNPLRGISFNPGNKRVVAQMEPRFIERLVEFIDASELEEKTGLNSVSVTRRIPMKLEPADAAMLVQDYLVQFSDDSVNLAAELIIKNKLAYELDLVLSTEEQEHVVRNDSNALAKFLGENNGKRIKFIIDTPREDSTSQDDLMLSLWSDVLKVLLNDPVENNEQFFATVPGATSYESVVYAKLRPRTFSNPDELIDRLVALNEVSEELRLRILHPNGHMGIGLSMRIPMQEVLALGQPLEFSVAGIRTFEQMTRLLNDALEIVTNAPTVDQAMLVRRLSDKKLTVLDYNPGDLLINEMTGLSISLGNQGITIDGAMDPTLEEPVLIDNRDPEKDIQVWYRPDATVALFAQELLDAGVVESATDPVSFRSKEGEIVESFDFQRDDWYMNRRQDLNHLLTEQGIFITAIGREDIDTVVDVDVANSPRIFVFYRTNATVGNIIDALIEAGELRAVDEAIIVRRTEHQQLAVLDYQPDDLLINEFSGLSISLRKHGINIDGGLVEDYEVPVHVNNTNPKDIKVWYRSDATVELFAYELLDAGVVDSVDEAMIVTRAEDNRLTITGYEPDDLINDVWDSLTLMLPINGINISGRLAPSQGIPLSLDTSSPVLHMEYTRTATMADLARALVEQGVVDEAMTVDFDPTKGGIDLDPNLFEIEKKGDGTLTFPKLKGPININNIEGFVPVIINVSPINSLPLLLGLRDTAEDESNDLSSDSLDPADRKARFKAGQFDQLSLATN